MIVSGLFLHERGDADTPAARLQSKHGSEPAGFDIHGKAVEVDVGSDYDSYKTFEIEFENSPSMCPRCYYQHHHHRSPSTPSHSEKKKSSVAVDGYLPTQAYADVCWGVCVFCRPRQLCPEVGRGHEGAQAPAHAAHPHPRGHGVGCVYGASGTGRFYVISLALSTSS